MIQYTPSMHVRIIECCLSHGVQIQTASHEEKLYADYTDIISMEAALSLWFHWRGRVMRRRERSTLDLARYLHHEYVRAFRISSKRAYKTDLAVLMTNLKEIDIKYIILFHWHKL